MGKRKLVPITCQKCGEKIMDTGIQLAECGFDILCPHCGKWQHVKGTKEKVKKVVKKRKQKTN